MRQQIAVRAILEDHDSSSLMNSFSITKGILAILVGCAIDDGHLQSEDQLVSYIPIYKQSHYGNFLLYVI